MDIIPAIDLIDGRCVRLSKGDYATKRVYNDDPLAVAKEFEANGIRRLHLVDLDGAKAGHIVNAATLEAIATRTLLTVDFGGGLKTRSDLETAFACGAAMVTGGSIAVRNPEEFAGWLAEFGSERIILGADAREGRIAVQGWTEETTSELLPFVDRWYERGVRRVICTDISRDGMLGGAAVEMYRSILAMHPDLYLVASGGVGSVDDLRELQSAGLPAAIVGKALYEGRIALAALQEFI